MSARTTTAWAVAAVLAVSACTGDDDPGSGPTTTQGSGRVGRVTGVAADGQSGRLFSVRLSAGQPQLDPPAPTPVVDGTPLTDAEVAAITGRLGPWAGDDVTGEEFRFPTQTIPAPRPGVTVDQPFPAPSSPVGPVDPGPVGPLQVVRYQPEGAVDLAPFVTITFDQPMVPVTTLGQLDAQDVPATLTPAVAGRWQWIGTKTLRFDHDSDVIDRLPMATRYRVEIPAGTTSEIGGVLVAPVVFEFETPGPVVQSFGPQSDSLRRDQVFVATFDQRVDPVAVLGATRLRAGGDTRGIRLATEAEIQADDAARATVAGALDGRWVAFRADDVLPGDEAIEVTFAEGLPSAEGPLGSASEARFVGRTYAPLRVQKVSCGWGENCPPGTNITIEFNNPLAPDFDPSQVTVDPALAGATAVAYGNVISVEGATLPRTRYEVSVAATVTDVFGQTLAREDGGSVTIGEAGPSLSAFSRSLITLDPYVTPPSLSVRSVNHDELRLRAYRVQPSDWPAYQRLLERWYDPTADPVDLSGYELLVDTRVEVDGPDDQMVETPLDLGEVFPAGTFAHALVIVEPADRVSPNDPDYWNNRPAIAWVQSTAIGLDAAVDGDEVAVWTTDLRSGAALGGVSIGSIGSTVSAVTAADGTARSAYAGTIGALVATSGTDTALLSPEGFENGWTPYSLSDELRWYVTDDRGIYRPGETVSVKGWIRRWSRQGDGGLRLLDGSSSVRYVVRDPQGAEIGTGTAAVNALGGFDLEVVLPAGANLGYAVIEFELDDAALPVGYRSYGHGFQIQEFRRPEFEATARPESEGPYLSRRPATVAVDATYYAGGPVPDAPVTWTVTTAATTYAPPGWDDYTFGVWTPWWYEDDFYRYGEGVASDVCCGPTDADVEQFAGTTDAAGHHYLRLDFDAPETGYPDLPVAVTANAAVEDLNRQVWGSSTALLVHPAEWYVGLRSARTFVRQGEPLEVEAVVTSIDGEAAIGRPLRVTAARDGWAYVDGQWTERAVDEQVCEVVSAAEPVACSFATTVGGEYTITATVTDDEGGSSRSELTRWVSGQDARPSRNLERQELTLVPDRSEYQPGDQAEILVQAPFATGEGLVVISRDGVRSTQRFSVVDGSAVVPVTVTEAFIPGVMLTAEVVGSTERTADDGTPLAGAPPRPAFATGSLPLAVPPTSRTLAVTATPRDAVLEPGGSTTIDVSVRTAAGSAVEGAEVAVMVVDEAVLALTGFTLDDPVATFYAAAGDSAVQHHYGRDSVVLAAPEAVQAGGDGTAGPETTAAAATTAAGAGERQADEESAPGLAPDLDDAAGGNDSFGQIPGEPIGVRSDFSALALFAPEVVTGAGGTATVSLELPDNLTRYRIMAVAVNGADEFGSAEANLTARRALMVRPSPPRFSNFGDEFSLPVLVQNQTDAAMTVDVVVEVGNLGLSGEGGRRVAVPANDRVEVRFPLAATSAGTALYRVAAVEVGGTRTDAAAGEWPVYTPATSEAFATYGVVDEGAVAQPFEAPVGVVPGFGGLEVTTSSTALAGLTDAVIYLADYPYRSSDAMASRILAITALRDVLDAFDAEGLPSPAELDAAVAADIAGLAALQNGDGGWPVWERNRESYAYHSLQAVHALVVARQGGHAVPDATLQSGLAYLAGIESVLPGDLDEHARDFLVAYALRIRALAGDADPGAALALWDRRGEDLALEAVALLWPVLEDPAAEAAVARFVANQAVDTAGAVTFTTDYGEDGGLVLASERRVDALVLDALIGEQPTSDLIPKTVQGLLAARRQGRWDDVQENAFVLLALKRYFDTFEAVTPDFVARVWLGEQFAGEVDFTGRTTDRSRIAVPTSALVAGPPTADIVVAKDGTGRLYYRIGLRTAPASLRLDPLDRGFEVQRTYEAVDDPSDVTRNADGSWTIRAGATVRVRLTMVAESQRSFVALVDPLPAGLEPLNPALAVTAPVVDGDGSETDTVPYPWYWQWFDHQNLRDDRAEAFATYLGAGVYEYTYVARATTPGTFVVPPLRAEEIYAPETFGRSGTDIVTVN